MWLALELDEGWNLITGISNPIDVALILDFNEIIIPGTLYGYDESYLQAEVLEPGKGYWLRTTTAGSIIISFGHSSVLPSLWSLEVASIPILAPNFGVEDAWSKSSIAPSTIIISLLGSTFAPSLHATSE